MSTSILRLAFRTNHRSSPTAIDILRSSGPHRPTLVAAIRFTRTQTRPSLRPLWLIALHVLLSSFAHLLGPPCQSRAERLSEREIGVIKSIMGQMLDNTNVASAFAYQPIPSSAGATLGPLIGGTLSGPDEKFPNLFGNLKFLKTYPYFLPYAIPATFTVVCLLVTYLFFEEVRTLFSFFLSSDIFIQTNPTGFSVSHLSEKTSTSPRKRRPGPP